MKKTKKILIILSMVALLFALLSFNASAATKSGRCGELAYYNYDTETCALTIYGSGTAGRGFGTVGGFSDYYKSIKSVVIEEGITEIKANTFSYCTSLESVSLPSTLKIINEDAFLGAGLTSVTIPEGTVKIGDDAFNECDNLTEIKLPDSLRYIGSNAFFYNAYWYNESNWENNTLYIDNHLIDVRPEFSDETLVIKDGTVSVAACACYDNLQFKNIVFPSSIKAIGDAAFRSCPNLTEITLPEGLEIIGDYAFASYNIATIKLPKTLTEIGDNAFTGTTFYYDDNNWDGNAFYIDNYLLEVKYEENADTTYKIKDGTVLIAPCALAGLDYSYISIPETVKYIGGAAFSNSDIKSIEIPDSVVKIFSNSLFAGCTNLEYVKFSDNVTDMGHSTFSDCSNLKTVILPKNLKVIKPYTFSSCTSLDNLIIPEGVTTIGMGAFSNCSSLSSFSIPSTIVFVDTIYYIATVKNVYFTNTDKAFDLGFSGKNYHPHVNCEYIEEKEPTCSQPGNTRGVYCPDCDAYVLGYSEIPATGVHSYTSTVKSATCIEGGFTTYSCNNCTHSYTDNFVSATGHSYSSNGVCSDCNEYNDAYNTEKEPDTGNSDSGTSNCSCNCHKGGFMGFIWKILRVFYKLFKTNAVCSCGVAHY